MVVTWYIVLYNQDGGVRAYPGVHATHLVRYGWIEIINLLIIIRFNHECKMIVYIWTPEFGTVKPYNKQIGLVPFLSFRYKCILVTTKFGYNKLILCRF